MIALRRRVAALLARLLIAVDPDPPMTFTTRRIDLAANVEALAALSDVLSGQIVGRGIAGRPFKPGDGTDHAY